jgi:hypothetical protein
VEHWDNAVEISLSTPGLTPRFCFDSDELITTIFQWHENTMNCIPSLLVMTLAVVCFLTGCHSPKTRTRSANIAGQSTRDNCYSLLHQLLADQKNVGLLRFIKREESDVKIWLRRLPRVPQARSVFLPWGVGWTSLRVPSVSWMVDFTLV